jgi:hypothetical protein
MLFAAVHESESGTERTFQPGLQTFAFEGKIAVGDRDRGLGVILFRRSPRIDRINLEMRAVADTKYCVARGFVKAEPWLILAVDLEFPGALPSIFRCTAGRRCRRQPEPR